MLYTVVTSHLLFVYLEKHDLKLVGIFNFKRLSFLIFSDAKGRCIFLCSLSLHFQP